MNEQPTTLSISPDATASIDHIRHTNKLKLTWGLICLIAPTALLIVTILAYALINFFASTSSTTPSGTESLFSDTASASQTIGDIVLFLVGGISTIAWLPGIIVGIVLLSSRKQV